MLCENGWEGGKGYTPQEVGELTLDQIFMLLADKKVLRAFGTKRITKRTSIEAASLVADDGKIRGRAADGSAIRGRVSGTSLARQLLEKEAGIKLKK